MPQECSLVTPARIEMPPLPLRHYQIRLKLADKSTWSPWENAMFAKLNHLAITTDDYTKLGMFYRAYLGMTVSGVTEREQSAISVGDGYVGLTLIPRRPGRRAGIDHFGIEVEDFDKCCARIAERYPDIEVVKRPSNRPFASFSTHDPAGNYFDLSQIGHGNRAEVYDMESWKQETTISHFAIRVREAERVAEFYGDVFELEPGNDPGEDGGFRFSDGRVTMSILPWKISDFNGTGIEQPAMDHIGFQVPDLEAFEKKVEELRTLNPHIAPRQIDFNDEGKARLALFKRCPFGSYHLADPDGNMLDVHAA
jgi:predicted enzyme related to lactoylglutathione lyase